MLFGVTLRLEKGCKLEPSVLGSCPRLGCLFAPCGLLQAAYSAIVLLLKLRASPSFVHKCGISEEGRFDN